MKNNNYFSFLLIGIALILSEVVHAQVQSNGSTTSSIRNQNPFLDASTNFSANPNKGKGLLFPQTNLTTFSFIVNALDAITFPTAFNGMIVYNVGTGNTLTTGSNPKTSTAVTPGFYYFSNPDGSTSVINGRWVRINDNLETTISQGNTLPATGNKTGDIFYLIGTGLQVYDGTAWTSVGGSVSGLGTAANLNAGTSANNLVQLDASGKLPAVDGSQLTNVVASSVTNNANLTGPITSVGNATSVASQTGAGNTFVMSDSPTLIAPILGVASASSLTTTGDIAVNGGGITTTSTTATLFNTTVTLLNIGAAATTVSLGAATGTTTINNYLKIGSPTVDKITPATGDLMAKNAEFDGDVWVQGVLNTPSDERLKKNIATLTGVLERLNQLRGVRYEFKDQHKYAAGPQVGVIAQELQKVFPELVSKAADGYLAVNYTQLSAVLIQAIKEQQKEIDMLKRQMTEVMNKLGIK